MKDDIYSNNSILQSINNNNPLYQIKDDEFDDILLKVGSLVSMLKKQAS